jgi:hypothetical protein
MIEYFSLNIFSDYRKHYLGNQFLPDKMGNLDIGPKETTDPVRNENGYTQTFDDPRRFITTYQIKYFKKKNFISFINTFFSPKVILIRILKDVIVKVMLLVVYKNQEQVVLLKIQKQQIH